MTITREQDDLPFPLSELISALSTELREARRKAEDVSRERHEHYLHVVKASIELAVAFERTVDGGISFKVFGVGADAKGALKRANETTMTVELAPLAGDDWPVDLRDRLGEDLPPD
jgi:hypothetical protein